MDARTRAAYEKDASKWIAARRPRHVESGRLAVFARQLRRGAVVADLGCGPGWYAEWLRQHGYRAVALDLTGAMLHQAGQRAPDLARVQADVTALPFRSQSLDGAWSSACYQHLPRTVTPLGLAHLHWALKPGAPIAITLAKLESFPTTAAHRRAGEIQQRFASDKFAGRLFTRHSPQRARDLFEGAGFIDIEISTEDPFWMFVQARRTVSLPDLVGPRLRLLLCGLNPSIYSADRGIGFARPGNRFWPALRAVGLVERERDPLHALARGIGMTDLVKRATVGSDELSREEYTSGLARVERLVRLHKPRATCFVGLEGWRHAVDRRAQAGWIDGGFGGHPAYLMPSTSGRNASARLDVLVQHLRTASG